MFHRAASIYFADPYCHREANATGLGTLGSSTDDAPSHLTWEVPKGYRA
jgi:hypothetical protein